MIEAYMGPTAAYAGTSSERQSVGLPGHCVACSERGHVAAHPDLGCGDVGCSLPHGEEDAPSAAAGPSWVLTDADRDTLDGPNWVREQQDRYPALEALGPTGRG